ncbi:hypothetical protein ACFFX1_33835 [Dactylosporangium sucinum]|uniref:Uncharacterized protein n=1 Tax=Dactylosporangium sucinum TaxID=1424081 RepID=A0A917UD58_9ACTN|nr:hypothetical protein [Dactylosporangium sucinum]GGM80143.1 hypothetical protein GCM10007977_097040 [Dactylosporangium sucinum]
MRDLDQLDLDRLPAPVASLLAAAAAPGRPHELAGEDAAVAGYRRAYGAAAPPRRRERRLAVLAVATVLGVSFGSAAYAAGTGRLPDPIQRTVHELLSGVPAPERDEPSRPAPSQGRPSPTPADLVAPCRAWEAFRADPHAPPVTGADRRTLATVIGGEHAITEYCRTLLGGPSPSAPTGPAEKPSTKPGNPSPGVPNGKKPSRTNS